MVKKNINDFFYIKTLPIHNESSHYTIQISNLKFINPQFILFWQFSIKDLFYTKETVVHWFTLF